MNKTLWTQTVCGSLVATGMVAAAFAVTPQPASAESPPAATELVWSPSGKQAVFALRAGRVPDQYCPTELYELDLDTSAMLQILQAQPNGSKPEKDLSCFYDPKYSADGQDIYFVTPSWATSGAIQAFDRKTGKVAFIIDGGPYLVIGSGPHKGMLLVLRRKYPDNVAEGAFEEFDLVSPLSGEVISVSTPLKKLLHETDGMSRLQKDLKELEGWQSW